MSTIIDLSHSLATGVEPYPGDPPVQVQTISSIGPASDFALHTLHTSLHAGTHLDAPSHFVEHGMPVEEIDIEDCVGDAVLIKAVGPIIRRDQLESDEDLIRRTGRVVIATGWYENWGKANYFSEHPVLSEDCAAALIEWGVRLVGVDFPSVDEAPYLVHKMLLGNGVLILENLTNLAALPCKRFKISALPLKIEGAEASLVRAVAVCS